MNQNFMDLGKLFAAIPAIVVNVESHLSGVVKGPDKLAAVLAAVTETVSAADLPAFMANTWPKVQGYVGALVAFYNMTGMFRR